MGYKVDITTNTISSTGGTALVGKILEKICFKGFLAKENIKYTDTLTSLVGLFANARTRFEEIRMYKNDTFFQDSLGLSHTPAPETLRLYLEKLIPQKKEVFTAIKNASQALLKKAIISPVHTSKELYIPVDIDTSPMDNSKSKKEGVSRTYKQFDGFHPIFAYIGQEGYMLNCELREGKQHCQNGAPEFICQVLNDLAQLKLKKPVLFRLDAGHDSINILESLNSSGHFFLVKRNLRKEKHEYWEAVAKAQGEITVQNERKTVYTGFHTGKKPANDDTFPAIDIVFKVTERYIAKDGTRLLFPELEVETYWTNLYEDPDTVIKLYHDHGTSEQFHSELKTDMNFERLPSGKFAVNEILLYVAMLTFNILRFIGQKALHFKDALPYRTKAKRKRLRKVIDDLIRIAVKFVKHSRTKIIKL